MFRPADRKPDFRNLEAVLQKKIPSRPTLFEMFLNDRLYDKLAGETKGLTRMEKIVRAYDSAGYDYVSLHVSDYRVVHDVHDGKDTISLNDHMISSREDFERMEWKGPGEYSMEEFYRLPEYLPEGMKVIPMGPGGVLENVIKVLGYENLCTMLYDDPQLVEDVFEKVGSSLVELYRLSVNHDYVGAILSSDDWGFNTQTMLSPKDMRKYVFPWHKQIVEIGHKAGVPVILHSCGNYDQVMEDVISDMGFDARHSYEDNIRPVEQAYEELRGRIAVLGGMDVDFMVKASPEEIGERAGKMIAEGMKYGGYALGTGNSVPEYIPDEHYFAMIQAALKEY